MRIKKEWCACGVKDLGERVYQIKYCPKHKAAPALYEALKAAVNPTLTTGEMREIALKALAQVEK